MHKERWSPHLAGWSTLCKGGEPEICGLDFKAIALYTCTFCDSTSSEFTQELCAVHFQCGYGASPVLGSEAGCRVVISIMGESVGHCVVMTMLSNLYPKFCKFPCIT